MKIIERYLIREILTPFIVVITVLIGLFVSFNIARFMAGGSLENLGFAPIAKLVLLKTIIALEVLIPISLYISIIIGLGRLSKDYEIIVLRSVGISNYRIKYIVLMVAIPAGIICGILSIYGRPWAYTESYILNAQAEVGLNMSRFLPGRFYGSEGSGSVVYIQEKDDDNMQAGNIFHYVRDADSSEIVIARKAQQPLLTPQQQPQIELYEGNIYQLTHNAKESSVIKFKKLTYFPDSKNTESYRRQTATMKQLWESDQPPEIAEFQWRLSRPIATILLALIAASFIRIAPRQDTSDKTYFFAALFFAVYYLLSGLAQSLVEHGRINSFPGVWWLYLLILFYVGLLWSKPIQRKL